MNDKLNLIVSDKSKSSMDKFFKNQGACPIPHVSDTLEGKVINKLSNMILVDLGPFKTGVVFGREFISAQNYIKSLKLGDSISVKILEIDGYQGYIELSIHDTLQEDLWNSFESSLRESKVVKVKIQKANRGGLITTVNGVQAFLPVSQLKNSHYPRVEGGDKQKILDELNKFVGQEFDVKIITADKAEKHLIVSEKDIPDEAFSKVISLCNVGDIVDGTISSVVDFGVFITFSPEGAPAGAPKLEGLAHISELDWQLIENPADLFKVGDEVKAKIIDKNQNKISLSIKALKENPWEKAEADLKRGSVVSGTVKKFNKFGAIVYTDLNIQGLLPSSELAAEENKDAKNLSVGNKYQFFVLAFSSKDHKLILSLRKPSEKTEIPVIEAMEVPAEILEENKDVVLENQPEQTENTSPEIVEPQMAISEEKPIE